MAHRYDFQFFQGIILLSVTVLYTNPTSDEYKEATKRIIYEVGLSTVVDVLWHYIVTDCTGRRMMNNFQVLT